MPDDFLGSTGTSGRLSAGGSATGSVEFGGDTDWFQIQLVAGTTYTFNLEGSPTGRGTLSDTYLNLMDSSGGVITYDDDSGDGYNSQITYTPYTSGFYYLEARGFNSSYTGTYTLSASGSAPPPPPPPTPSPDSAGSSRANSRWSEWSGGAGETISETIGWTDTDDYFGFNTTGTTDFYLSLYGLTADANVELLNATGTVVGSASPGTSGEYISQSALPAGSYWIRVYSASSTETPYTLSWSAPTSYTPPPPPTDNAGGSRDTAYALTLASDAATASDYIGGTDTDDYYKFITTGSTNLSVQLSGTSADTNVALQDASGTAVSGTSGGATAGIGDETLTRADLAAGTYYLRVYPGSTATSSTSYTLTLNAPSSIPTDSAGDSAAEARSIGALSAAARTFTDYVGSVDTADYYQFTTTGTNNLSVRLTGLGADANVLLLNTSGSPVSGASGGATTGTGDETLTRAGLAAGTYYVQVYPASDTASTTYSLSLSAMPAAASDSVGGSLGEARSLGVLSGRALTDTDQIGGDDVDFYRFTVASNATVAVRLTNLIAAANVELISDDGSADGNVLQRATALASSTEASLSYAVRAGTYYVRVTPQDGADTPYNLNVSSVAADRVGNTVAGATLLARPLSLNGAAITRREFVGDVDQYDYYKFSVAAPCTMTATLDGMDGDANLTLVNALNIAVATATESSTGAETLERALTPGTYYLRVQENAVDTNYTFSLSGRAADSAGGDIGTARDMGILRSAALTANDWVGTVGGAADVDVYRFTIRAAGTVGFNLNNVSATRSADADLELLNSTGAVIQTTSTAAATTDAFQRALTPGVYFVRVRADGATETSYNLNLSSVTVDNGPNTIALARDLGRRNYTGTDAVGDGDRLDYYKFNLVAPSTVHVGLTGMTGNADLAVLDDNAANTVIRAGTATGSANENLDLTLEPGTYFVRISDGPGADTPYTLNLTGTILDGAGDERGEAEDLGTLSTRTSSHMDYVAGTDIDFYRFRVAAAGTVSVALSLTGGTALTAALTDAAGATVATSNVRGAGATITRSLAAGDYYVRVTAASARLETGYRISASTSTASRPRTAALAAQIDSLTVEAPLGTATAGGTAWTPERTTALLASAA